MYYVANTKGLVRDGVIDDVQASEIARRARSAMVALAVNTLMIGGAIAVTAGILMLQQGAEAAAGLMGFFLVLIAFLVLERGSPVYRIFGNAAAIIGIGLGMGAVVAVNLGAFGAGLGGVAMGVGAVCAATGLAATVLCSARLRFAAGALLLMGAALHVLGVYVGVSDGSGLFGMVPLWLVHVYFAGLAIGAGWLLDLRFITALAIVPLAQVLETGTFYSDAMYAFYSPEPTLTVLLMGGVIVLCLLVARAGSDTVHRQTGILAVMAFIVMNLCFLVGSIWGDVVGQSIWGPARSAFDDYQSYRDATEAFAASGFVISETVYTVVWALLLAGITFWAATTNRRGLFNTGMTFAAIHAYTQFFESFGDHAFAYIIAGVAAIPLAWVLWRFRLGTEAPSAV